MKTTAFIVGIIFLIILFSVALSVILSIPFATIWALNTLFKFTIAYTFWNWLACWILILTLHGVIRIKPTVSFTKK